MRLPHIIAIVGSPGAGKSTLQRVLFQSLGIVPVDDSRPLRLAAMELYGLSWDDVSTQAGKARTIDVCGETKTVRALMGELGCYLEEKHGDFFFPEVALRRMNLDTSHDTSYSFASVRGAQPTFYKNRGGLVVEVRKPGAVIEFPFDKYDRSCIDGVVENSDSASERDLIEQFISVADRFQSLEATSSPLLAIM